MAKIVKNKKSGLLGVVLIEFGSSEWDLVYEDGSYLRTQPADLDVIGETDLLRIPPPPPTETTQQEIVESALNAIAAFKKGAKP